MRHRVRVFLKILGFWLLYFWVARAVFLGYHYHRAAGLSVADLLSGFGSGFRLDASGAAYLTAVPAALLVLSPIRVLLPWVRRLIATWVIGAAVGVSILVAADLELFAQWDKRIDASVVWYLKTPAEAWASTGGSPRLLLVAVAIALATGAVAAFRRFVGPDLVRLEPINAFFMAPLVLLIGVLVIPARGGVQTWPLTGSSAYRSAEPFLNQAAQNAAWGFFDSGYRRLYDRTNPFVTMSPADAERLTTRPAAVPTGPSRLLTTPKPNVLVIIWESASARAFGSLGGRPGVTPMTDSLARQGLLFRQFYAAGDRTDKGVAAILSGFPALPRGSIMMVPNKTRALPFLNADLGAAGYRSSFYYGGELEFASLKGYLVNAGYQRVIGKAEFPAATWISKWGAYDGAVADRVLDDLDRETTPFFSVWLTLSSHEPFETPDPPRISGSDWQSRFYNSLAYTDHVIGQFIARARTKPWWDRTLVVIVADHGRRVSPMETAPSHDADAMFRIPMLWLGGALAVTDSVSDRVGSQTDIPPTLLGAVGLVPRRPYRYGTSLLDPNPSPFAYYGFETGFGLVTPDGSLVYDLRAGRPSSSHGRYTDRDVTLGRALSQLTYQDYLDR